MKDYPWGKGTVKWLRDAALNDSDKSFTVPAGKVWSLRWLFATLATTATVGNRFIWVIITNGANDVWIHKQATSHPASTTYNYNFAPQYSTQTGTTERTAPLMDALLPAGYVIRIYDSGAIDAAADDLTVVLHYVEYDA